MQSKIQRSDPIRSKDLIQSIRSSKDSRNTHLLRRHSVPRITMAKTSPHRLQSCFGSPCVTFGSKLHWDYALGHFPSHPPSNYSVKNLTNTWICFIIPPKNCAVQGYLNTLHRSPFGVWSNAVWEPYSRRAHCYGTNRRILSGSGTRTSKTDCADTLNAALGANLNSVPTMLLHTGHTAELALEHNGVCTVLKSKEKSLQTWGGCFCCCTYITV